MAPPQGADINNVAIALIDQLPAILIAAGTLFTAIQSYRNGQTAKKIAEQTDGQLSKILEKNDTLQSAFTNVIAAVSAREGRPIGVRAEDVRGAMAVDLNGEERRQVDRRKTPGDASK